MLKDVMVSSHPTGLVQLGMGAEACGGPTTPENRSESKGSPLFRIGTPLIWFVSLTARMLPCHGSGAGSIPAQTAIWRGRIVGLVQRFAKPPWGNTSPRVRIPPSPPGVDATPEKLKRYGKKQCRVGLRR